MGVAVIIMGRSGTGKSTSMRGMDPKTFGLINVLGKPLPFRGGMKFARITDAAKIRAQLAKGTRRCYVIDDAQYIMSFEEMDSKLTGFDKWNAIGYGFISLVRSVLDLPGDTIVYFLMHSEVGDDGRLKAKTLGKLIDNHYTLEGLFPVVLMANSTKERHWFSTVNDGGSTVKAPMGMFEQAEIDNDLKAVDSAIRSYWNLAPLTDGADESKEG